MLGALRLGGADVRSNRKKSAMVGTSEFDPAAHSRRGPVPKDVRRAIDYLRACMGKKVTTTDLAAASGVAERTLRKHFREFVGVSPLAYLRRLRLAAVRDELIGGASVASITEIATRHGFNNLGRFSADYRRCFGEPPSSTVRKSRPGIERSAWGHVRQGGGSGVTD